MKAFAMLPNDPRIRDMNIFQWLWCYYNLVEDDKEDQEVSKIHFDRLAFITNPEVAKSVFEYEERMIAKGRNGKKDSRPIGGGSFRSDEAVYQSKNEFDLEIEAATKGYDPSCGLTAKEFLEKLNSNKELDVMNDSFEDLLNSGQFHEVPDTSAGAGDPFETSDDFLARVEHFRFMAENEIEVDNEDVPQDLETKSSETNKDQKSTKINKEELNSDLSKVLEEYGIDPDDFDILEVVGDDEE